ncbi:725_t:CDS:2 [Racocetra fulgida]|uniref:725_t:CDS:1 n=1 Tax=Racocetra fulgida TaxID=60492 RepID=A0A9N9FCP1_9GLOM|nr:725_t:CDS:2 [Racocetra fulgida]
MVSSGKDASSSATVASPVTSGSPSELVHSNRSVYGVWEFFNIPVPSHGAKPIWKPSSQNLSEKFRLYMAGSMVGDAARRMFNGWTRSRQDGMEISNRDEKNRSLDMSSSSSISLSPSEPVDYTAPRLYKKASNSRLSSHRRPNSRLKAQTLSPIDDNPSTVSSNDDQPNDQATETDESKTTVTINVSDPRSEQPILVPHQEIDCEIEGIPSNQLNQNFDDSQSNNQEINLRNGSCQNSMTNNDGTNNQTLFVTAQESEGEIETSSITSTPKNSSEMNTQEENFVKPGNRRRRRKTKSSKNNPQQNSQQESSNTEQRSFKHESLPKYENTQQNINGLPRPRQSDEMSYTAIHPQQPRQIAKLKTEDHNIWQKSPHTESVHYQAQPHHHLQQRSDQSTYYMQGNKRNETVFHSGTAIPAKATLPEINNKAAVFPRRNSQSNVVTSNSSMNRFTSYAGAISSQNRPPPNTMKISHNIPSTLPADSNIMAPVPVAASVREAPNHQWSPFWSGLSIQINSPAPPEDIHNKWASNNSITSASLFSSPMPASNYQKGELTTAKVEAKEVNVTDEMIRGRSLRTKILSNKDKMNEGMINMDQGRNVPQFSLFDKQLMYPSKS